MTRTPVPSSARYERHGKSGAIARYTARLCETVFTRAHTQERPEVSSEAQSSSIEKKTKTKSKKHLDEKDSESDEVRAGRV
jgi:hypothetical protein